MRNYFQPHNSAGILVREIKGAQISHGLNLENCLFESRECMRDLSPKQQNANTKSRLNLTFEG